MVSYISDFILFAFFVYILWRQSQLENTSQTLFESIVYYLCGEHDVTPEEMDEKAEEYARDHLQEIFEEEVANIVEDYED